MGVLARNSQGATADQINAGLSQPLPRAKLRFILIQLEKMNRIRSDGATDSAVFSVAPTAAISDPNDKAAGVSSLSDEPADAAPTDKPAGAANTVTPDNPPPTTTTPSLAQTPPVSPLPGSASTVPPATQNPISSPPAALPAGATPNDGSPAAAPSPAPASMPSGVPGASARGATEAQFADAFEGCVYQIVVAAHTRVSAIAVLQQCAIQVFTNLSDRRAFVTYAKAKLEILTPKKAEEFGIELEQFEVWRKQYFGGEQRATRDADEARSDSNDDEADSRDKRSAKRRSGSGSSAPATPKGLAKLMAQWIDPYLPEEMRPYARYAVIGVGSVVVAGLLQEAYGHLWLSVGIVAAVIAVAALVTWMRKGGAGAPSGASLGVTEGQKIGGSASNPDPDLSVSALADVASGSVQRVSVSPRSRRGIYILAFGGGALVVALAAAAFYWQHGRRPSESDVRAWLAKSVAPLPVRVAALDATYLSTGSAGCVLQYKARIETTEPLFKSEDTTTYLRAHFPTEMTAIDAGAKLLAGPDGARLRAAAQPAPDPNFSISACQLFSVSAPPGASTTVSGTVTAWPQNNVWLFTGSAPLIDRRALAGEPKPAKAWAVDFPDDEARLRAAIVEQAAYATKVQAAATALAADLERERVQKAADLERERQQRLAALNQLLQRGTFLSGMVIDLPKPDSYRVLVEVTDCSATTHQITLVLRNASGWYNTRSAKGDWSIDADNEVCTAKVWFSSTDRTVGAGKPLDDPGSWYLTLRVRPDGSVAAEPRGWELQRVAAADVATAKAEFGFGRTVEQSNGGTVDRSIGRTVEQSNGGTVDQSNGGSVDQSNGGSVDRSISGAKSVRPLDRSTVPPAPATPAAASTLPLVATADAAAYVLSGQWLPLPRNTPKVIQSTPQKLSNVFDRLNRWEDSLAGKTSASAGPAADKFEKPASVFGELTFDGRYYVPVVSAQDLVILYVGPLTAIGPDQLERYPELKNSPAIELAPMKMLSNGIRHAPLFSIAPGFIGFGSTRVEATVERTTVRLLDGSTAVPAVLLRCTAPLVPGRYALSCGPNCYELAVE